MVVRAWQLYTKHLGTIVPPRTAIVLLVALVLLGITTFGGWRSATATATELPTPSPGESIDAAPLRVVAHKAFYANELGTSVRAQPGVRLVIVKVSVTNISTRFVGGYAKESMFRIDAPNLLKYGQPARDANVAPVAYRVLDGQPAGAYQPGVPADLALVWEQQASAAIPTQVSLTVAGLTWRRSSLDGSYDWFDPTASAVVTLPVVPLPKA